MSDQQRAAMQAALEAMRNVPAEYDDENLDTAILGLEAALAEQPPEPVAWMVTTRDPQPKPKITTFACIDYVPAPNDGVTVLRKEPLYAAPKAQQPRFVKPWRKRLPRSPMNCSASEVVAAQQAEIDEWRDGRAPQPLKERTDFIVGYAAGLADGKACAERDAGPRPEPERAPWTDFLGQPIRHGDLLTHPNGEEFVAVKVPGNHEATDAWRAVYEMGSTNRLCLQIGDKGRAVLASAPQAQRQPLTDEQIGKLAHEMVKGGKSANWLARVIEAAHGIGGKP